MKAVVIGAGRIGCGLVGELLRACGYEVVFVARNQEMVSHLNRVGQYRINLTSTRERRSISVYGVSALWTGDTKAVAEAIGQCDLVATAVGPQNLGSIAPLIAAGLRLRRHPLNILAFENLVNAGPHLRKLVAEHLPAEYPMDDHGFSGALVRRAVSQRIGDLHGNEPLIFLGDMPEDFIVHGPALRQPLPQLRGMMMVDNYAAHVLRKLYMFSAGHATTAYLGALKGYHYVHSAIRDQEIRAAVIEAMREGQQGLAARYGSDFVGDEHELEQILERFDNASLNDPIDRVGRDPRRKLGANERLIGAARLAHQAGVAPHNLALASAAAFCFSNPTDPSCGELQQCIEKTGVEQALHDICGLSSEEAVSTDIAALWQRLAPGRQRGNLLLSLDRCQWAWS